MSFTALTDGQIDMQFTGSYFVEPPFIYGMRIIFSMTTSRRLPLCERTIKSLRCHVHDLDRVNEILHLDDGSSADDLLRMRDLFAEAFPRSKLRSFAESRFPNLAHHACMMQKWHDLASPADYVFHCEDDWEFVEGGNLISDAIVVMNANPAIGQVGLWRKPPQENIRVMGEVSYWVWRHDPSQGFVHRLQHEDDIDPAWPHFSLRPSIIRCEALRRSGNFQVQRFFEHAYAVHWTELGWNTAFLARKHCVHQAPGPAQSVYALAGTLR